MSRYKPRFTYVFAACFVAVLVLDARGSTAQMIFPSVSSEISSPIQVVPLQKFADASANYVASSTNAISRGVLRLAQEINLDAQRKQSDQYANHVSSPVSIAAALSLALMGSFGKTFIELAQVLGFDSTVGTPSEVHQAFGNILRSLSINSVFLDQSRALEVQANRPYAFEDPQILSLGGNGGQNESRADFGTALFVQEDYPIRDEFKAAAKNIYNSDIINVNFKRSDDSAKNTINNWVSERTHGKINNILPMSPNPEAKAVIATALYYYGLWTKPFLDSGTKLKPFFPDGQDSPSYMVEMMANGGIFDFHESFQYDCKIIALPYKDNSTIMYVILPNKSSANRLRQFHEMLSPEIIESLIQNLAPRSTILLLPKMHLTTNVNLRETLMNLGVKSLFNPEESNLALLSPGQIGQFSDGAIPPASAFGGALGDRTGVIQAAVPQSSAGFKPFPFPSAKPFRPSVTTEQEEQFIFSRLGGEDEPHLEPNNNCSEIFNSSYTNVQNCSLNLSPNASVGNSTDDKPSKVIYKKIGNQIGRRVVRDTKPNRDWLKDVVILKKGLKDTDFGKKKKYRRSAGGINNRHNLKKRQTSLEDIRALLSQQQVTNPGLYADAIIHKVDLKVTERGTEGAAASGITLTRDGSHAVFRADAPFLFLIRNEPTKMPLFYGTVNLPRSPQ